MRNDSNDKIMEKEASQQARCAICLFGLPRAFESLVLPSLVTNVIAYNPNCDYFVHFYNLTTESKGRSSTQDGIIQAEQVYLLSQTVQQHRQRTQTKISNNSKPVHYTKTDEADFWRQYDYPLLHKIHTTLDDSNKDNEHPNRTLYHPWKAKTYTFPTTVDNIIKMWHSIQSVWNLMDKHGQQQQATDHPYYVRVAMLRLDVVYLTPINIWQVKKKNTSQNENDDKNDDPLVMDLENQVAVVPSFGKYPVNDRFIYGPYQAVREWSIHRFERLDAHVQWMSRHDPGFGMHSERFIHHSILPYIRQEGFQIWEHDSLCFVRARVDESLWITDCWSPFAQNANPNVVATTFGLQEAAVSPPNHRNQKMKYRTLKSSKPIEEAARRVVEQAIGRSCYPGTVTKVRKFVSALQCQRTLQPS